MARKRRIILPIEGSFEEIIDSIFASDKKLRQKKKQPTPPTPSKKLEEELPRPVRVRKHRDERDHSK